MNKTYTNRIKAVLAAIITAIITCTLIHYYMIVNFNSKQHSNRFSFPYNGEETFMNIDFRGGSTSSWLKRDLNLKGIIYDGKLYNNSNDLISKWTLKININDSCYINQFWNGSVEIHQHVTEKNEKVQTLNLANYDKSKIHLDFMMDGSDLLIPLEKGDYLIYYPSVQTKEIPIEAGNELLVGMIFYYKNQISLTDYRLDFYLHRDFSNGLMFKIIIALVLILIFLSGIFSAIILTYKKTEKEMELTKSGISYMSELYRIIYIVDLINDTITPVSVNEKDEKLRPKESTANEQFKNLFSIDAAPSYTDLMLEFCELTTISDRLEKRNNISIEYQSKDAQWKRIRFIAMDRTKENKVEKVLFTIEQITQEKEELNAILGKVQKAELESNEKSAFLETMSYEIQNPINEIINIDKKIIDSKDKKDINISAEKIKNIANKLLSVSNNIIDYSKLEAGKLQIKEKEYSLKELISEIEKISNTLMLDSSAAFKVDFTPNLPDILYGDSKRLKQIILKLISNSITYTKKGYIRLAIYGKVTDSETVHLLISVKDTGIGIPKDKLSNLLKRNSYYEEHRIGINLITGLLKLMNSELKATSVEECGSDFYFELNQKIKV